MFVVFQSRLNYYTATAATHYGRYFLPSHYWWSGKITISFEYY